MEPDRKDRVIERFLRGSHAREPVDDEGEAEILPLPPTDEHSPAVPKRCICFD